VRRRRREHCASRWLRWRAAPPPAPCSTRGVCFVTAPACHWAGSRCRFGRRRSAAASSPASGVPASPPRYGNLAGARCSVGPVGTHGRGRMVAGPGGRVPQRQRRGEGGSRGLARRWLLHELAAGRGSASARPPRLRLLLAHTSARGDAERDSPSRPETTKGHEAGRSRSTSPPTTPSSHSPIRSAMRCMTPRMGGRQRASAASHPRTAPARTSLG
jgi:hypothetical protein